MKKVLRYLSVVLAFAAAVSCSRDSVLPEPQASNGAIMIDVSSMPHTKLTAEDLASEGAEAYVNHIDLFIFGEQAMEEGQQPAAVYHERISYTNPSAPQTMSLDVKKGQFISEEAYDIYVVANSTVSEEVFAAVTSADGLRALTQTDDNIHLTGLNLENVPEAFLMDAYVSVVLNPEGEESEDITLDIQLTRAAAKIVVELFEGNDKIAIQAPDNAHIYHFRNLPYSTSLLPRDYTPQVRSTTGESLNSYIAWDGNNTGSLVIDGSGATVTGTPQISLKGYVYSYDYSKEDMDEHTSLVVNIPLKIDDKNYPVNYYKIPLTNALKFERNKMYRIRANINAPGAQMGFEPIELTGLQYEVVEWNPETVNIPVGGDLNKPAYLQLNMDHVNMYNVNRNEGQLRFSSSSYISEVRLVEAYYYNAYDQKIDLRSTDQSVYNSIHAVAQENVITGGISITSPFVAEGSIQDSHRNTIRYMTFEVENEDGIKAQFTVAQYPTLYITNEHGHYSYREDFSGSNSGAGWSDGRWNYVTNSSSAGFFSSKVAVAGSGNNYTIYYANWRNGSIQRGNNTGTFTNPRMYNIHVTATSSKYVVSKPRLDENGYTEGTLENSNLVSPSFFIASQLGGTQTSTAIEMDKAQRHCKEYMEVTSDGKVYKDWRLPTKAEIDIIEQHQSSSPAMIVVLTGSHYYCAYNPEYANQTGSRANWIYTVRDIGNSMGGVHVRCVHDAY